MNSMSTTRVGGGKETGEEERERETDINHLSKPFTGGCSIDVEDIKYFDETNREVRSDEMPLTNDSEDSTLVAAFLRLIQRLRYGELRISMCQIYGDCWTGVCLAHQVWHPPGLNITS